MWPQQAVKDPFPGMHHLNYINVRHPNSPHSSAFQPKAIQHVACLTSTMKTNHFPSLCRDQELTADT